MARGGRGFQGTVLKALRVPEHKLTVTGVREIPPYTELTVQCPSLLGARAAALPPTTWVRMWIPENGREYQRAYTLTRINRAQAIGCSSWGTAPLRLLSPTPSTQPRRAAWPRSSCWRPRPDTCPWPHATTG